MVEDYFKNLENVLEGALEVFRKRLDEYSKDSLFSSFMNYLDFFKSISDEDKYIIFGYINPSDEIKNIIIDSYNNQVEAFKEIVTQELDRVIKLYMKSSSVSYGEALLFAEKHFDDEIGFLNCFLMGLNMSIFMVRSIVRKKDIDMV